MFRNIFDFRVLLRKLIEFRCGTRIVRLIEVEKNREI